MPNTKTGIELIAQERNEQIEKHFRTVEWDLSNNKDNQLIKTAVTLLNGHGPLPAEWDFNYCIKMNHAPRLKKLIIAGALIAAEIDRLNNS